LRPTVRPNRYFPKPCGKVVPFSSQEFYGVVHHRAWKALSDDRHRHRCPPFPCPHPNSRWKWSTLALCSLFVSFGSQLPHCTGFQRPCLVAFGNSGSSFRKFARSAATASKSPSPFLVVHRFQWPNTFALVVVVSLCRSITGNCVRFLSSLAQTMFFDHHERLQIPLSKIPTMPYQPCQDRNNRQEETGQMFLMWLPFCPMLSLDVCLFIMLWRMALT
jgi:hypothetical protein